MIEIKNLNKTFKTEGLYCRGIKNINFTVNGEIYGIIGDGVVREGANITRCINMTEKPTSGRGSNRDIGVNRGLAASKISVIVE